MLNGFQRAYIQRRMNFSAQLVNAEMLKLEKQLSAFHVPGIILVSLKHKNVKKKNSCLQVYL
jgi:hypothetical protein